MTCQYHEFVDKMIGEIIWNIMDNFHHLIFYISDDTETFYANKYVNKIQTLLNIILTNEQEIIIRKNGERLENVIEKWVTKNPQISETCVQLKIYEYMIKQFKQPELINIIGNCACHDTNEAITE